MAILDLFMHLAILLIDSAYEYLVTTLVYPIKGIMLLIPFTFTPQIHLE